MKLIWKNHRLRSRYPFERYTRYPFERYRWYPFSDIFRHTDCPHSARENGLQAAFSTSRITLLQWCTSHHLPPNLSSHIQNRFVRWKPTYAGLSSPSVCPASKRFHGQTTTPITDPDPWPQNLQVAKPIKVIVTGSVQELKRGIWLLDRPTNVMSRFSAIKTLFYVWFLLKVYAYIAFYK